MARKIMVEDPVHPKYQDPSTPFDVWLDYMEENHPEYDAIHFYETEELVMSDKAFADSLSDNDVVALEADYGKDSNLWTPEVESRWYQAIDKPVESSLWGGLDDTVLDSLENAGVPNALLIALSAAVGNKKGTAKRTKKMLTNSSKKTDDVVKANQDAYKALVQKKTDGLATPKIKKGSGESFKTVKSGELVGDVKTGGPAVPVSKPIRKADTELRSVNLKKKQLPSRIKDEATVKLGLTDKALKQAIAGVGTGLVTGLGLMGSRGEDGSLQTEPPTDTVYPGENKEAMIIDKQIAEPPKEIKSPPTPEKEKEVKEEKPGWQQNPGDNWWNVNTESPYWQTQEGAKEAFELYGKKPAWAASVDKEEFDFVEFKDLLGLK